MSIEKNSQDVKNNLKPSKTDNRIWHFLLKKREYWEDKRRLQPDGSFYVANEEIAKCLRIEKHTVIRSKKRMARIGWIKYHAEPGRGHATFYQLSTTPATKQPLTHKEVWRSIKALGKESACNFYLHGGYTREEIDQALEA